MATSTLAAPKRSSARTLGRVAIVLAIALVLAGLAAGGWFFWAAKAALPQVDGDLAVPGLSGAVSVIRDTQGVPHITATTPEDLFFAQGFVTAQDRLWQMDMTRRYAAGEIAEVLGAKYVEHDRRQRTFLIPEAAERAAAALSLRNRSYFEAYARGVNACIAQQKHLPIEFRLLRYAPRAWTVKDSLLVAAGMIQTLNLGLLQHELDREKITAKVGPELAADLYPNTSWRDRPPQHDSAEFEAAPEDDRDNEDAVPEDGLHRESAISQLSFDAGSWVPGSNNWVVSGAHTASGKPLLSNDMHLPHQIPNVWYEAHLTAGTFDVAGVTLPGFPYVIVGHNQRIAWGFTNIAPDTTDLFVESFNDQGQYLTPDGWRNAEHRRETIHVRGSADVNVEVTITRHGPIVSGLRPGETRPLALKWTFYDPADVQVPFFDMNAAQNWEQFRAALSHFGSPAQNVVYADVDGHIGYQAAARVPIRAAGDGSTPAPGSDDSHEWIGYVPFDKLPSVFDPASGIIATANGRVTPDGYPYVISNEWGPPYRTERIYKVLGSGRRFTPADMLTLQTDIYSDFDRFCAERFAYAVDHAGHASPRAKEAAELMRNWDGRMSTDSAAAAVVVAARQQLAQMLLEAKLGDDARAYQWFMSSVWLENTLLRQPARWLPPKYASYQELLAAAVEAALGGAPRHLTKWRWGRLNQIALQHPLLARVPLLRRWTGPGRFEQSGDGYTVKQVGVGGLNVPSVGPSERMTVDFSNLDASTLNIVTGESGQIFSRHYQDQWLAWYEGRSFTFPFSRDAVAKARAHELRLSGK